MKVKVVKSLVSLIENAKLSEGPKILYKIPTQKVKAFIQFGQNINYNEVYSVVRILESYDLIRPIKPEMRTRPKLYAINIPYIAKNLPVILTANMNMESFSGNDSLKQAMGELTDLMLDIFTSLGESLEKYDLKLVDDTSHFLGRHFEKIEEPAH